MAAGDKGAVVVTGAISLSYLLANGIIDKMFNQGKTLGQAVLETKQGLVRFSREAQDAQINWETLGDPTLRFNQE